MKKNLLWLAVASVLFLVAFASFSTDVTGAAKATPTRTRRPSRTPTQQIVSTPTATLSPVPSTATLTSTPESTPTETPVPTDTVTPVPTDTVTPAPTDTPPAASVTPSDTIIPETATPTNTATFVVETPTQTDTPTLVSATPTPTLVSETPIPSPTTDTGVIAQAPIAPGALNSIVLIANADVNQTDVTLHVFDLSGAVVFTVTQTIAVNGMVMIPMPASLGPNFNGSATVFSSGRVSPLVLNANASNAAREIYESSSDPAASLTFPIFRHLGSVAQESVIAVQNADPAASASVTLHYYDASGSEPAGSPLAPVTIPPLASYYFHSQTLFGSTPMTVTAQVDSTTHIAGAARVLLKLDTAALSGFTLAREATAFYLNRIERVLDSAGHANNWSEIYVRNSGSASTQVTVNFYRPTGALQATRVQTIAANGFTVFDTRTVNQLGGGFAGFARVIQGGTAPLAVSWLEANNKGEELYGFNGLPSSQFASRWACADAHRFLGIPSQFTKFNIVNVDSASANFTLTLYDPSTGAVRASKSYTLAAGRQLTADLVNPSYLGAGISYNGLVVIQSTNGKFLAVDAYSPYGAKGYTGYTCSNLP